ncbi:MAG: COG4223 family protein [Bdellovibrionales bacterium]
MSKNKPIENAEEVIEAFGGIRPMAKKLDVAVTTIQGWKKRNVIPAARRADLARAAQEYGVDLSGVLDGAPPANENVEPEAETAAPIVAAEAIVLDVQDDVKDDVKEDQAKGDAVEDTPPTPAPAAAKLEDITGKSPRIDKDELSAMRRQLDSMEKTEGSQAAIIIGIVGGLIVLVLLGGFLFWQASQRQAAEEQAALQAVQEELSAVKEEQGSFFDKVIPKDLGQKVARIKEQAVQAKESAGAALEAAQAISDDVLNEQAGSLEERLGRLETHLQDITGSPVLAGLLSRMQDLQNNAVGEAQLGKAMQDLQSALSGAQAGAGASLDDTLAGARDSSEALSQTFEGVPQQDLKAAALLLGMSQFRSSLNRDNEAFDGDLQVLKSLVGEDNTELNAALDRLAPHAQSGVLTPAGLSSEFRTFAGEAVVASLKGEDVTLQERAQARMNELFQVEKDGELISGTPTQAALAQTEQHLQQGDLAAAISAAQSLDGNAAAAIAPWLDQAQATLAAQQVKTMLTKTINASAYGASAVTAGGLQELGQAAAQATGQGGNRLIRNDETGINIYVPNSHLSPGGKNLYQ